MSTLVTYDKPDSSKGYRSKTEGMYQVEFTEIPEGYQENWPDGERTCTRVLECAWDQRLQFQMDLKGQYFQNGVEIARNLPERHPDIAGVYCTDCQLIKGIGRPSIDFDTTLVRFLDGSLDLPGDEPDSPDLPAEEVRAPAYGRARFLTTWKKLPYPVLTDEELQDIGDAGGITSGLEFLRFVQVLETYATETITLPSTAFQWVNLPQSQLPQGLVKVFYTKEITFIWHKVPKKPRLKVEACLGRVNKLQFNDYAPHTLLFLGPEIVLDPGTDLWTASFKMLYRKVGWNRYFRPRLPGSGILSAFEDFSTDGSLSTADGKRLIDEADLSTLFELDP